MANLLQCFGHHQPLPGASRSTIKSLFILYIIFESIVSCNSLNSNLTSTIYRSRRGHPTGKRHSPFHPLSLFIRGYILSFDSHSLDLQNCNFSIHAARPLPRILVLTRFRADIFASVSLSFSYSNSPHSH